MLVFPTRNGCMSGFALQWNIGFRVQLINCCFKICWVYMELYQTVFCSFFFQVWSRLFFYNSSQEINTFSPGLSFEKTVYLKT